jgi:amidohydrolase
MLEKYIIEKRRYLHQHPETGFQCKKTREFLMKELEALNVDDFSIVGKNSIVATIKNGNGKTVGLRADFDALKITEETGLDFSSVNKGIMHACGHDAHTAMLLGATKYLVEHKDEWSGTVKLIFQEAEEGPDPGGAFYIVESGKVSDVEEFFALHVSPGYETGVLAINYGNALAAADIIRVEFIGKGTHAAYPHLGIDPIVMQADFITKLQTIVSRKINPFDTAVVTIGEVKAGTTFNVIPENAVLKGTVRTFSEEVRSLIEKEIDLLAKSVASSFGGSYKFKFVRGYDSTINVEDSVNQMIEAGKDIFDQIQILTEASMGAEDFSRYINLKKGAIAWLGVKHPNTINHNIHHPKFNLNEQALIKGAKLFINIVKEGNK